MKKSKKSPHKVIPVERRRFKLKAPVGSQDAAKRAHAASGAKYVLIDRGDGPLAIVRPKDPRLAIRLALQAKTDEDFQAILESQEYTYQGAAARLASDPKFKHGVAIVDPSTMEKIGDARPGDSYVGLQEVLANHAASQEPDKSN